MQIQNNNLNDEIVVNTFLSISNQSFIAPEILFINKPYTVSKSTYFKMLVSLNLNPDMNKDSMYEEIYNISNLDFKLYTNDLKEIKPVNTVSKNYIINNQNKMFIEYEIPYSEIKKEKSTFNFGFSHDYNAVSYKSKGEINLNLLYAREDLKINMSLISYLSYYDLFNKKKTFNSKTLLFSKISILKNELSVNKRHTDLVQLEIKYIQKEINNIGIDNRIIEEIEQVKNNTIFPAVKISQIKLNEESDFKKFYKGSLNIVTESYSDNYKVKYKGNSSLNEDTKIVDLTSGDEGLYLNPFIWTKDQNLEIILEVFGKEIKLESKIKSYANYKFSENFKFIIDESKFTKYKFDEEFWKIMIFLNSEDLIKVIKEYEIF
ncbi:hypothetical protein CK556_03340 [Mesoplasma chauliocola]|uniref:Uncharacterized protein n=1 Tax=Mesoplasma chauliocola TaxID=216427 RepID=A0A249SP25_9MOLU|nr:hypothetical protein [Mesoplasma chauliocola]ASZ09362.1 hypothetical protein CK556_03340 [Mesoplasma chauliocola]